MAVSSIINTPQFSIDYVGALPPLGSSYLRRSPGVQDFKEVVKQIRSVPQNPIRLVAELPESRRNTSRIISKFGASPYSKLSLKDFKVSRALISLSNATIFRANVAQSSLAARLIPAEDVLVKVFPKEIRSGFETHMMKREVSIHRQLHHPHIVAVYDVLEDKRGTYLVMESTRGFDLHQVIKNSKNGLPEHVALNIIRQILMALKYMHVLGFAHRDIKPQNIFFKKNLEDLDGNIGALKLTNFGFACERNPFATEHERRTSEMFGFDLKFAAPEILSNDGSDYNPEFVGLWSVGVLLYLMISKKMPFNGESTRENLFAMISRAPSFVEPVWLRVSIYTKRLIRSLLTLNSFDRPRSIEALEAVEGILETFEK